MGQCCRAFKTESCPKSVKAMQRAMLVVEVLVPFPNIQVIVMAMDIIVAINAQLLRRKIGR